LKFGTVDKDVVCHRFYSTRSVNALPKEALERFGDFKIRGLVFRTVKFTDDPVLPAEEEKVLQGLIDSTSEIGKCYEMKMNWKKKTR